MRTKLPTNGRRFFRKAVIREKAPCDCITSGNQLKPKQHGADPHAKNCAVYVGTPKPPAPDHTNKVVMTVDAKGRYPRLANSATHAMRVGGHKGGTTSQSRGTAHRWTSKTAARAARRYWNRVKVNKRLGQRLGYPAKRARPFLNHAELRVKHTQRDAEFADTYYNDGCWFASELNMMPRPISERRALTRLGYLREKGRTPVPAKITMSLVKQKGRGRITVVEEGQTMK